MCFQEVELILKICQESKIPCLKNITSAKELRDFFEEYKKDNTSEKVETTAEAMMEAFAKYEEDTYKALYTEDSSLSVENIKKYFDNTDTNIWNTYTDYNFFTDNPGVMEEDDDNVTFSDYDWEKIIEIVKKTDEYSINLHHYEGYATIFLDFNKDGLVISNAFPDGCREEHFIEDLTEALEPNSLEVSMENSLNFLRNCIL